MKGVQKREREVERHLVQEMAKLGIECIKWVPDQLPGMPDRLCLLPGGMVLWIELKTKGGRLSEIQKYRHQWLRSQGHEVKVIWSSEQVDELIESMS